MTQKKGEVPDWFYVTEDEMERINRTNVPASDQKIPNFVLGGPMCCYVQGMDCQCGGDTSKCPPHLQKFQGK